MSLSPTGSAGADSWDKLRVKWGEHELQSNVQYRWRHRLLATLSVLKYLNSDAVWLSISEWFYTAMTDSFLVHIVHLTDVDIYISDQCQSTFSQACGVAVGIAVPVGPPLT